MFFKRSLNYKALLYYKMENEFNQFEQLLLRQSPKDIFDAAYEVVCKRNLLMLFDKSSTDFLSRSIIKKLYCMDYPMDALYQAWLKEDSTELDLLRSCTEAYCHSELSSQQSQTDAPNLYSDAKFELIEVCEQTALFSDDQISDDDIPDGMYHYDLREGDGFNTYFGSIEPNVLSDFAGSIITLRPFDFGTDGYIELDYDTEPNFLGKELTIEEFSKLGGDKNENNR